MAQELETKLRVDSLDPVRDRLEELGARRLASGIECNSMYDRPSGELTRQGVGLRIRTVALEDRESQPAVLTVKGPADRSAVKSREEIELQSNDAVELERALQLLGFVRVLRYEKRRESWQIDDCRVELDQPPHVGLFVEIEGPTAVAIEKLKERLGLAASPHVDETYVGMMVAYCKQHGLGRFDVKLDG